MVVIEMRICTIDTMNTMSEALEVHTYKYAYMHVRVTVSQMVVVEVRTCTIDTLNTISQTLEVNTYIYIHACGSDSQSDGSDRGEDMY